MEEQSRNEYMASQYGSQYITEGRSGIVFRLPASAATSISQATEDNLSQLAQTFVWYDALAVQLEPKEKPFPTY